MSNQTSTLHSGTKKTSVLITGCSKGFGLMFARRLAQEGHRVYATARNLQEATELLKIADELNNLQLLQLDVMNLSEIENILKTINEREDGTLDVLINNAGYGLMGAVADLDLEALEKQFKTNLFAPIQLCRTFLPLLQNAQAGGLIINISSVASYLGLPSFGAYSASKVALNALSMSLATENAAKGLSVAVVEPGPFSTNFRDSVKQVGTETNYSKVRSKLFVTQEDPSKVVNLISNLIQKKLAGKLGTYNELPVGRNTGLFRVLCRWLPQALFVNFMAKAINKEC
jgi:NAD(P)-dependent dehydrogenase (short-subunit alcohol dehydrogenase family)